MSNEIAVHKNVMPSLAVNEDELINVLRNSLYPNAQADSIKLVMGYCRASGLDPMQKPVQIVPMWNSAAGRMIDVIMPGIGLYRTQAARSGQYAGVTEPEFGEDVTESIGGVEVTYPKWCKVVVKRLLPNGTVAEFAATERWKENYAVKGGKDKSIAPNAMWAKRTYGQLAKCAEAQALRKAFPECGSQPTADEMEGKAIDDGVGNTIDGSTGEIVNKREAKPKPLSQDIFDAQSERWKKSIVSGKKTVSELTAWINAKGSLLTEGQLSLINSWKESKQEQEPKIDNPAIDPDDKPFD